MKKTLLFVAALFITVAMSAQEINFTTAPSGFTAADDAVFVDNGATGVSTLSASTNNAWTESTFDSYPGLSFVYKHSSGTSKIGFKFGPAGGYVQADASDVTIVMKNCKKGEVIGLEFSAKGGTAVTASELITGKPTASLDAVFANNITLVGADVTAPAIATGADAVKQIVSYTVNADGSAAFKAKSGYRIYRIKKGGELTSSIENAIADSGIFFNGTEVVNNERLNIQIYDATGKVVATAKANYAAQDLISGIYFVRAEGVKGAIKFVK